MTPPTGKPLPDLFVTMRVLDRLWRVGDATLRTRLQAATNLSYDGLLRYLTWLDERGLIVITTDSEGTVLVRITPRGVEAYKRFMEWSADFAERRLRPPP